MLLFLENALSLLKRCFKSEFFGDLPGVETDIDDILVWGTNAEEHDQHLVVLKRCESIHFMLNNEKCKLPYPKSHTSEETDMRGSSSGPRKA